MRAKFTWKDHLRGIWGAMFNVELALEMRIKHLNSLGYGDENNMVQALKHTLAIKKKKPE